MKGLTNKVFVALSFLSVAGSVFGMERINERHNALHINVALAKRSMLAGKILSSQIHSCISVSKKLIADAANKNVPIVGIDSGLMGLSLLAAEVARQQISVLSASIDQICDVGAAELNGLGLGLDALKEISLLPKKLITSNQVAVLNHKQGYSSWIIPAQVIISVGLGLAGVGLYENFAAVQNWLRKNRWIE